MFLGLLLHVGKDGVLYLIGQPSNLPEQSPVFRCSAAHPERPPDDRNRLDYHKTTGRSLFLRSNRGRTSHPVGENNIQPNPGSRRTDPQVVATQSFLWRASAVPAFAVPTGFVSRPNVGPRFYSQASVDNRHCSFRGRNSPGHVNRIGSCWRSQGSGFEGSCKPAGDSLAPLAREA